MKRFNWILVVLAGLGVSGALQAAPSSSNLVDTKAIDSRPLPKGSRVVAGNSKNEFFVLPGSESAGMKVADSTSAQPVVSDSDVETPVKVADASAATSEAKPDMANIKVALDKALRNKDKSKGKKLASVDQSPTSTHAARKSHHGKKKMLEASNGKHHSHGHHNVNKLPKAHHLASNSAHAKIHHSKVKKPQIRA